jgi:hypothetical protein
MWRVSFFFVVALFISGCNPTESAPPLEEQYKIIGYTTASEAIKKFKEVHQKDPHITNELSELPLFKVTHEFGSYTGQEDPDLKIEYVNEKSLANFTIQVFPLKNELPLGRDEKTSTMKDGTSFSYTRDKNLYIFRFKTKDWSYILSTNSLGENSNMNEENFIRIAEHLKSF